jgi:muramoyltetrapeptide carboxypeptidase
MVGSRDLHFPLLDWKLIKKNPKIFLGYSDITVLHNAIYKKTGLITFYGPCVMPEFGEFPFMDKYNEAHLRKALVDGKIGKIIPSEEWTDEFLDWFKKDDIKRRRSYTKNTGFEWWRKGKVSAEIFGGAIPSINHLAGTEYWNDYKGKILFIDLPEGNTPGVGISISDFDTYLADLYNLNVFKNIKGLVIGRPYAQSQGNLQKIKELVELYTKNTKYPILYGVDIGHTTPMITLPFGVKVLLDSEKNVFEVKESFIK